MKIRMILLGLFFLIANAKYVYQALNVIFSMGVYPMWVPYTFSGMPSFASLMGVPLSPLIFSFFNFFLIWMGADLLKEIEDDNDCQNY